MCNQIYIIIATNGCDFDESEICIAGESKEAADEAFKLAAKNRWDQMWNVSQKFYGTLEEYIDAWHIRFNILPVHPLPQPKPGE